MQENIHEDKWFYAFFSFAAQPAGRIKIHTEFQLFTMGIVMYLRENPLKSNGFNGLLLINEICLFFN